MRLAVDHIESQQRLGLNQRLKKGTPPSSASKTLCMVRHPSRIAAAMASLVFTSFNLDIASLFQSLVIALTVPHLVRRRQNSRSDGARRPPPAICPDDQMCITYGDPLSRLYGDNHYL